MLVLKSTAHDRTCPNKTAWNELGASKQRSLSKQWSKEDQRTGDASRAAALPGLVAPLPAAPPAASVHQGVPARNPAAVLVGRGADQPPQSGMSIRTLFRGFHLLGGHTEEPSPIQQQQEQQPEQQQQQQQQE